LLYGWVPAKYVPVLKEKTETLTGKIAYLKFVEPTHEKPAPVALRENGVLSKFQMLTVLRGVPGYFEVDPTIIFALLFVVMYGMMFGDVGEGLIISLWGAVFVKRAKGFMGISRSGINKLGWIMVFSGISAAFFGILYGDAFLYQSDLLFGLRQALHLPALGPLTDIDKITQMMVIALLFGVISLLLALTLGFTNKFLREGPAEAILSGKGLLGIILYVTGVVLVYRVVSGGMNIDVFLYPSNLPLTVVCITAIFLVLLSPLMLSIIRRRRRNRAETIFEGFGEAIETFIGLLANSFSYLRLAAFAMAHAALGLAAVMLSPIAGSIAAYVMMNVIGVLIEGFAVGIQSMRLLFYEFSTKFYVGEGMRYRPLKLNTIFVRPQAA
jgi:V/A-type H+-transporting ATPase subunit I